MVIVAANTAPPQRRHYEQLLRIGCTPTQASCMPEGFRQKPDDLHTSYSQFNSSQCHQYEQIHLFYPAAASSRRSASPLQRQRPPQNASAPRRSVKYIERHQRVGAVKSGALSVSDLCNPDSNTEHASIDENDGWLRTSEAHPSSARHNDADSALPRGDKGSLRSAQRSPSMAGSRIVSAQLEPSFASPRLHGGDLDFSPAGTHIDDRARFLPSQPENPFVFDVQDSPPDALAGFAGAAESGKDLSLVCHQDPGHPIYHSHEIGGRTGVRESGFDDRQKRAYQAGYEAAMLACGRDMTGARSRHGEWLSFASSFETKRGGAYVPVGQMLIIIGGDAKHGHNPSHHLGCSSGLYPPFTLHNDRPDRPSASLAASEAPIRQSVRIGSIDHETRPTVHHTDSALSSNTDESYRQHAPASSPPTTASPIKTGKKPIHRQAISCYPCRIKKLRCDGKEPCAQCVKRNGEESCSFATGVKRRGKAKDVGQSSTPTRVRHRERVKTHADGRKGSGSPGSAFSQGEASKTDEKTYGQDGWLGISDLEAFDND